MKRLFLALAAVSFLSTAKVVGQQTVYGDIPSVVKNSFAISYPNVTDVEWKKDGALYRVEFETGKDVDHKIWYDAASNVVLRKEEVMEKDLPAAVLQAIRTNFADYTIDDVDKISSPDSITYEVELEAFMKRDWEVIFSSDGRVLSKTKD